MKPREPRRKVLIRARMCAGGVWSDVCLLDLSSRGAQLQSACPPPRGAYVEVRRGPHIIIARVVWAKQHRFGVRAQDVIPMDVVIAEPASAAQPASPGIAIERRAAPRPLLSRHDRSRLVARATDFAALALLAGGGATLIFGTVASALANPLAAASAAMGDG